MTVSHADACPLIDAYRIKLLLQENEWVIGTCTILLGLFIGLFGLRFLRPIAGILIALTIFSGSILFSSMFGYFDTVKGIIITLSVGLVAAILLGVITLFAIWLAIGVLGVLGGFFLGALIYELTLMQFDFVHAWGFMTLAIIGVITGLVLSCKYGREVILLSTSLCGGLGVMRGTCYFFTVRFPSIKEIVKSIQDNEREYTISWQFWLYASEWLVFFAIFTVFQCLRWLHRPISAKETVNTSLN